MCGLTGLRQRAQNPFPVGSSHCRCYYPLLLHPTMADAAAFFANKKKKKKAFKFNANLVDASAVAAKDHMYVEPVVLCWQDCIVSQ